MKITIQARPLGQGRVAISTIADGQPVEAAFVGPWYAAAQERRRRCESWSECPEVREVIAEAMPVQF